MPEDEFDSIESAMKNSRPLMQASNDDLWEEVKRRFNAAVLLTMEHGKDDSSVCVCYFEGGIYTCIGMAQEFLHQSLNRDRLFRDDES